jgi:hypothetical protein
MSLLVHVYVRDVRGEVDIVDAPEGCCELAGFERWRGAVWGADVVRSLGARYLPTLATGDLWVEPAEVAAFAEECALLRANVAAIATGTERPLDTLSARLANIEDAARRALPIGGGVLVW